MTRPQFVRRSLTREQLEVLSDLLRLSGPTRLAVGYVLIDGHTQVSASDLSGTPQPHISRALSSIRRLDSTIRAAYPGRQRAAEAVEART